MEVNELLHGYVSLNLGELPTPSECEAECVPQPVWMFLRQKSLLLYTCTFETATTVKRYLIHLTPDGHKLFVVLQSIQKHHEIRTSRKKTEESQAPNP